MVDEIVREQLFEYVEVTAALYLFGIAANYSLCFFAWVATGHVMLQNS
jgi:hypothetical protein